MSVSVCLFVHVFAICYYPTNINMKPNQTKQSSINRIEKLAEARTHAIAQIYKRIHKLNRKSIWRTARRRRRRRTRNEKTHMHTYIVHTLKALLQTSKTWIYFNCNICVEVGGSVREISVSILMTVSPAHSFAKFHCHWHIHSHRP